MSIPDNDPASPAEAHSADSPQSPLSTIAQYSIPLALGLLAAAWAAVGLTAGQEGFSRLLRNDPWGTVAAFALAIAGVLIALIGTFLVAQRRQASPAQRKKWSRRFRLYWSRTDQWWANVFNLVGAGLLVVATLLALWTGITTYSSREHPTVVLSDATRGTGGAVTLSFESAALSLQADHRMLLRVLAFKAGETTAVEARRICGDSGLREVQDGDEMTVVDRSIDVEQPARVLFWGETGPSSSGTANNSSTVQVESSNSGDRYVCALAVLSPRDDYLLADRGRFAMVLVDLRSIQTAASID